MRTLNTQEISEVSGSGILSDLTGWNGPLNDVSNFFVTLYNFGVFLSGSGNYIKLGPDGSPF
ncbi:hypothetical protein WNB94_10815 [Aquabacterium sp. A3]|uniref:hypothetical protein n=1 Tax=Aquabacterium sp. A3 TaxID=3132829 RepID=UPI00311A332A